MSLEKKIRSFLNGPRKGETFELRNGLVSQFKYERKDAIQRVIQAMTVGKDVSALFPDVLKNIATYDLEQKKLVYLYLMNYAKSHPELCILAVNTFVQDTEDPNPLVRALAIRTMGCIRVQKMVDYMEIPLRRTLADDNPYVRKTAAICVAKLFDLDPEMCVEQGFVEALQGLLKDPNPMVVANALNSLHEVRDMNRDPQLQVFAVDAAVAKTLLACLNECTEWGRISILQTLAAYTAPDATAAQHVVERVVPQLQHANPAVVLAAISAVVAHVDAVSPPAQRTAFLKKLLAPLVSLVSALVPEAQYVGLKNIRIVLERYPQVLSRELRVFFIKYSDPLYLKLEKLEIMVRLASESNASLLLGELKEYAMEFEPALVRKAIRAVGAAAIKLASSVVPAINLLVTLVDQRGGQLVINESVIVLTNVLRRYPGRNDLITLVVPVIAREADAGALDDPQAVAGYIWLLGEYPKYFQRVRELLAALLTDFLTYESVLQLNVLTAIVKINLALPNGGFGGLLQEVLDKATRECENADVRDKAYIYWRLLSLSSADAQLQVILTKLPPIKTVIASFNPAVLDLLVHELSTLASVYHKPAFTFVDPNAFAHVEMSSRRSRAGKTENMDDLATMAKHEILSNARNENLLDFDDDDSETASVGSTGNSSLLDELNDLFSAPAQPQSQPAQSSTNDILSLFDTIPKTQALDVTQGVANLNVKDSKPVNNDLLDLF